jgi:KDO2-lipid IV(A) lauroyltransferase
MVWKFSFIPFNILYRLADVLKWLLFSVFRYRRHTVYQQLHMAFPKKSESEIDKIARASYQNLADIIVESIKGFTMSEQEFRKRYIFTNPEIAQKYAQEVKSTIQVGAHYGNWEWGAISYPLWFKAPVLGFYKPLTNEYMEEYGRKKRGRFKMELIPIGHTSEAFRQYGNDQATYVFVSDQSTWSDNAHWVTFLGQDTACPPGADKWGRHLECPVFYSDIQRIKRGFYEVTLHLLYDGKETLPPEEITIRYMKKLEDVLTYKPENWLWSHKRWKKKRSILTPTQA